MEKYCIAEEIYMFQENELTAEDRELVEAAKEATRQSYAPYSGFRVGAALRLANGMMVTGSNQENAAYPSGLCAERVALFHAQHTYPDQPVRALAIAAFANGHFCTAPIAPCGACRQVMLEVEDRYKSPMRILLYGTQGIYAIDSVKTILPFQFVGDYLKS